MRVRREKLDRMRDRGVEPCPVTFPRTTTIADLRAAHPDLEPDERSGSRVGIAGRVVLSRTGGKLCFATLRDGTGEVQVMLSLDEVGEEALANWKADVDLGDHVGIEGEVISSRRGELSVMASSLDDAREGAAAAARQAQGPHRPGGAGADALRRPRGQRRLAADGAQPRDGAAFGARDPAPARLPRGRDASAAAAARRRVGSAVHDAPQRLRPARCTCASRSSCTSSGSPSAGSTGSTRSAATSATRASTRRTAPSSRCSRSTRPTATTTRWPT